MFYINTISHGGAERVITRLATDFSELGYDVIMVTSFRTPDFEFNLGERVKRLVLSEERVVNPLRRNIVYTYRLRSFLKDIKPDILISFMPEANFRAILASVGLSNKCVVSVRNDPNREYGSRIMKLAAKTLYQYSDGVVFQTEDAQRWFPFSIQKKSHVIINQVDKIFFETKYDGVRKDVVTTGRLVPQKNHKMLIDAWAGIADSVNDRLLIYGEGELKETLQKQINSYNLGDKIILKGNSVNVSNDIKSAKLYVLSSNFEGMPNALMEAMALGIPCISTDCPCGGPRMLFNNELKRYLVPIDDVFEMRQAIKDVLLNDNLRERLGELCKQRADLFRPNLIIEEWKNYFKEVMTH